ncbi:MAG: His-Xaa-Ser repeat protein HxsA3 [Lachnospiraceae bacterium]|nr:His-Xaa-Ser repeat protein HxsA3 [Lachnospiraceae bacterium]
MNNLFPEFQKSLENLIEDEEGTIPGKKLLTLGTMVIILSSLLSVDAFAGHRSHSSHKSHSSHSSGSGGGHGSHSSHESHQSHESHSNHGSHSNHSNHSSHSSHSNVGSHSNSRYSAEGDVTYSAPSVAKIPSISVPAVEMTADTFGLPEVNQNIQLPNGTPVSSVLPSFAVPASTTASQMDDLQMNTPSPTDIVE